MIPYRRAHIKRGERKMRGKIKCISLWQMRHYVFGRDLQLGECEKRVAEIL